MTALSEPPFGNGVRFAARPLAGGGTPAAEWLSTEVRFPAVELSECRELVVVGAHPDDETLGLGAAVAMLGRRGVPVHVVSATDGGRSHPNLTAQQRRRLEQTRRGELHRALRTLGVPPPVCLGLPDGEVAGHEQQLTDRLAQILAARPRGTWCAATWRGDGHPDHEAVGRAAAAAAARTGVPLIEYPVWMWHWAVPDDPAVPWERALRVPLDDEAVARKTAAAQSFTSQFTPMHPQEESALPPFVLTRLLQVGEVVFR